MFLFMQLKHNLERSKGKFGNSKNTVMEGLPKWAYVTFYMYVTKNTVMEGLKLLL